MFQKGCILADILFLYNLTQQHSSLHQLSACLQLLFFLYYCLYFLMAQLKFHLPFKAYFSICCANLFQLTFITTLTKDLAGDMPLWDYVSVSHPSPHRLWAHMGDYKPVI
jgi:hypothetical protein